MKRKPLDKETGRLKGYAVSMLYLHLAGLPSMQADMWQMVCYMDLARRVGLPWVPKSRNVPIVIVLRDALRRMERLGFVKVKPYTHNVVCVKVVKRPKELCQRHGDGYVWHCFDYIEQTLIDCNG